MKGLFLEDMGFDTSSEPDRNQQQHVKISSDIFELSRQYPMFSEEEDRLRNDLRACDINSTALR